ncbi:glycosyltransferase family 4 protein [Glycomyces buryatensis]|nr:glycosyltransferase family 4 protein [Glycomyces buryatensis]
MRITFLVRNIWGIGGTIKTTLNTAEALLDLGHDVTIVSCVRHTDEPGFPFDPRLRIVNLWDVRDPAKGGDKLSLMNKILRKRPSYLDSDKVNNMVESSVLFDRKVKRCLRDLDTDVVVGTHVSMNLYMAKYGHGDYVKVAQEHMYLDFYSDGTRERILREYPSLDSIVTITEADAKIYREAIPEHADKVVRIPNSIPGSPLPPSELAEPVVMTAGRLTGMKGFDILIKAFAQVAGDYPEWKLKIFGRGKDRKKLQGLIAEYELESRVELPGAVFPLDEEWRKASIAAIPSRFEPFGLVIVEAMASGLPVVASAVKHGPLEIIQSEENGLLVAPKKPTQLANALSRLMGDEKLRRRFAEEGLVTAKRFEPEQVVGLHVELFEQLLKTK